MLAGEIGAGDLMLEWNFVEDADPGNPPRRNSAWVTIEEERSRRRCKSRGRSVNRRRTQGCLLMGGSKCIYHPA
jgi:hypothetical protein